MEKNAFIVTIPMPFTGESIVDGILVSWKVRAGDTVQKGQHIAEIETEKSVWEFEAPCGGEIVALKCAEGDVVDVGAPLLEMLTDDRNMQHLEKSAANGAKLAPSKLPTGDQRNGVKTPAASVSGTNGNATASPNGASAASNGAHASAGDIARRLSPRIKKMIQDAGIADADLVHIKASGPDGRITAVDVGAYLDELEAKKAVGGAVLKTCYVAGIGTYVPEKIVKNSVFLPYFDDIDEEYIEKVTGIRERRWSENESTSDLALRASRAALESAAVRPEEIDLIIVATTTPDMPLPSTACALQQKLGCATIPAFDIAAACSGWLYGLSMGRQYIQTGVYRTVLVVAAEVMSKFTNKADRATAFLFGDGAGAAVLSADPKRGGGHELSDIAMNADPSGYDIIYRKAGGSEFPPGSEIAEGDEYWFMDGGRMFRSAVTSFSEIIENVSAASGVALENFAWIVPHQANQRILKSVAHKLKVPIERFFFNIEKYGNTSAASIPLCLKDLESSGRLRKGDRLLLCAVGAGVTIAGGVLTW